MKLREPRQKLGPIRACLRRVGEAVELIADGMPHVLFGLVGAFLGRVLSLGFYQPSPSSWEAIGIGYVAFLALVVMWNVCG
ncbi:hypothetical protein HNQ65_001451 [Prosthecobacter vanneervenii]|uniref:Uncharacterized protein n=1 Tax=Prosthecobacter vanneervenii TaxID=48466 RepID=A0A7W7Y912_9BACT|nr:hypothetical protein [Prosthecobacter vanneervenii]